MPEVDLPFSWLWAAVEKFSVVLFADSLAICCFWEDSWPWDETRLLEGIWGLCERRKISSQEERLFAFGTSCVFLVFCVACPSETFDGLAVATDVVLSASFVKSKVALLSASVLSSTSIFLRFASGIISSESSDSQAGGFVQSSDFRASTDGLTSVSLSNTSPFGFSKLQLSSLCNISTLSAAWFCSLAGILTGSGECSSRAFDPSAASVPDSLEWFLMTFFSLSCCSVSWVLSTEGSLDCWFWTLVWCGLAFGSQADNDGLQFVGGACDADLLSMPWSTFDAWACDSTTTDGTLSDVCSAALCKEPLGTLFWCLTLSDGSVSLAWFNFAGVAVRLQLSFASGVSRWARFWRISSAAFSDPSSDFSCSPKSQSAAFASSKSCGLSSCIFVVWSNDLGDSSALDGSSSSFSKTCSASSAILDRCSFSEVALHSLSCLHWDQRWWVSCQRRSWILAKVKGWWPQWSYLKLYLIFQFRFWYWILVYTRSWKS